MPEERPPAPRRRGRVEGFRGLKVGRALAMEGRRFSRGGEVDDPCPPASQPGGRAR